MLCGSAIWMLICIDRQDFPFLWNFYFAIRKYINTKHRRRRLFCKMDIESKLEKQNAFHLNYKPRDFLLIYVVLT